MRQLLHGGAHPGTPAEPGEAPLAVHIHPHLTVIIDGREQVIPAWIGITPARTLPVHTHDTSGTIHVESSRRPTYLLGDFFRAWGRPLTKRNLLGHRADAGHAITLTVNGTPSRALGDLPLRDGDDIVVRYGPPEENPPRSTAAPVRAATIGELPDPVPGDEITSGGSAPSSSVARAADSVPDAETSVSAAALVRHYAPIVYLHEDEPWGPANPDRFIAGSELKFSVNNARDHTFDETPDPQKLGSGGYRYKGVRSNECSRPRDGRCEAVRKAHRLDDNEGYYLDLKDSFRHLDKTRSGPVYWEFASRRYIKYWFFYRQSGDRFSTGDVIHVHEGDWEHVVVNLDDRNRARSVTFHEHNRSETIAWNKVEKPEGEGDHFIVYSALGSHASYPHAGFHPCGGSLVKDAVCIDHAKKAVKWDTAADLRRATPQPWYDYGGAWGHNGLSEGLSGPIGPKWQD
ncbi:MAG TPA: Vps62-related protein [Isosphaeraceae bacterium]